MPAPLTRILARSEAQARQILISKRFLTSINSLQEITEAQLGAKAEMTIELLRNAGTEFPPPNMEVLSARKLIHGGILYKLSDSTSASWVNTPGNRSALLEHFGTEVIIKDRAFHFIIKNIPISFNPTSPIAITDIKRKGGLQAKSVVKARYIKPIAHRNPKQ
jgi:hypothetical protein